VIAKLNFYDFYGYLIPGVAFLAIIWLPFGIVTLKWPPSDLGSAVAALIVAYIVGLVLQVIVVNGFPPKVRDQNEYLRYPSSVLLDPEETSLAPELKKEAAVQAAALFGIDLSIGQSIVSSDWRDNANCVDARRRDAFLLARSVLVERKLASYTEQYQGMYAVMSGLAVAFWLGFAYLLGWAAAFRGVWLGYTPCILLAVGLGVATVVSFIPVFTKVAPTLAAILGEVVFFALLAILWSLGHYAGSCSGPTFRQAQLLLVISVLSLFAAATCFAAYKYFSVEFAKAVWRDFVAFRLAPPPSAS
jgi:hypothetical protein